MRKQLRWNVLASVLTAIAVLAATVQAAPLPAPVKDALASSKYVYIATSRKDGTFGKPAEIWFLYHDDAVYVASPPTTHRVRRIKAGRPLAKIAVGKPDGPSFSATGAVVNDATVQQLMLDAYAKKYPDGWPQHADKFRSGFKDGSRVLIKYVPKD
jgi:hypothetical protein